MFSLSRALCGFESWGFDLLSVLSFNAVRDWVEADRKNDGARYFDRWQIRPIHNESVLRTQRIFELSIIAYMTGPGELESFGDSLS
jgi:hypothetical protein